MIRERVIEGESNGRACEREKGQEGVNVLGNG
jgi:hypothetical protein